MHFAFVWHNLIVVNALLFQMFHFVASMLPFSGVCLRTSFSLSSSQRVCVCVCAFPYDKRLTWIKSGFCQRDWKLARKYKQKWLRGDDCEISLSSLLGEIMASSHLKVTVILCIFFSSLSLPFVFADEMLSKMKLKQFGSHFPWWKLSLKVMIRFWNILNSVCNFISVFSFFAATSTRSQSMLINSNLIVHMELKTFFQHNIAYWMGRTENILKYPKNGILLVFALLKMFRSKH